MQYVSEILKSLPTSNSQQLTIALNPLPLNYYYINRFWFFLQKWVTIPTIMV